MKTIKDYIQFAIDNGLDGYNFNFEIVTRYEYASLAEPVIYWTKKGYNSYYQGLEKLITSKPFIEAIARGLHKKDGFTIYSKDGITVEQAIAIRENSEDGVSLDEFIENILNTN